MIVVELVKSNDGCSSVCVEWSTLHATVSTAVQTLFTSISLKNAAMIAVVIVVNDDGRSKEEGTLKLSHPLLPC